MMAMDARQPSSRPPLETLHFRWMIQRDLPEIYRIGSENFEFPSTLEDLRDMIKRGGMIGRVVEFNGELVGYLIYELLKKEFRIEELAVKRAYHRRGVGRFLVNFLRGKVQGGLHGRKQVTVRVRESNLDGLYFFRAQGFVATELVRTPFEDDAGDVLDEDAIDMQFKL